MSTENLPYFEITVKGEKIIFDTEKEAHHAALLFVKSYFKGIYINPEYLE